jgi:dethiobiotin synthetase/adenosylmethionine--8-amino-7-oxononanoate aminotransferase
MRGYDVAAVVLLETDKLLRNAEALRAHLPRDVPLFQLPAMPAVGGDVEEKAWLAASREGGLALAAGLRASHARRVRDLVRAPERALRTLWWPFTQHSGVRAGDVTVIDARHGDALLVHDTAAQALTPLVDACSSWWTQGVSAAEQPALARAIG